MPVYFRQVLFSEPRQHTTNLGRQRLQRKRLGNKIQALVGYFLAVDNIISTGRSEKNAGSGAEFPDLFSQFPASHTRHHQVGQHQVDFVAMIFENFESFAAIGCFKQIITKFFQYFRPDKSYDIFVFDKKNRFAAAFNFFGHRLFPIGRMVIGTWISKIVPFAGAESTLIKPPACLIIP